MGTIGPNRSHFEVRERSGTIGNDFSCQRERWSCQNSIVPIVPSLEKAGNDCSRPELPNEARERSELTPASGNDPAREHPTAVPRSEGHAPLPEERRGWQVG